MVKARLFQAVCTAALLAAAPAFAQSNTPTGDTGIGGTSNNPTAHETSPSNMGPGDSTSRPMGGAGSHASMDDHSTHRSAMSHPSGAMHAGRGDSSEAAAVDRLNDRSYQAARQGQGSNASAPESGPGMMAQPKPSGGMNGMSRGSMSGEGSGGDGGGGGGGSGM
jgi:hypothetical protein